MRRYCSISALAGGVKIGYGLGGVGERNFGGVLPAVERDAPGDARQPRFAVENLGQAPSITPDPRERLLSGVLGVVVVAQEQIRDSVNKPRMLAHDGLQLAAQFLVGRLVHRGRVAQNRLPFDIHSFTL